MADVQVKNWSGPKSATKLREPYESLNQTFFSNRPVFLWYKVQREYKDFSLNMH